VSAIKDLLYIIITAGGVLVAIIGVYWRIKFKLKENDKVSREQEKRIERLEAVSQRLQRSIDKKMMFIEMNILRLLEKQGIEPAQKLFDDDMED
jgi:hypothetical protein